MIKKIALCGWFSLEKGQATSGDIFCLNRVIAWLKEWGIQFEVIYSKKSGGPGYASYNSKNFSSQIFVCGPIDGKYNIQTELFEWFEGKWYFWSNSVVDVYNRMDATNTLCRDGLVTTYPDFSFLFSVPDRPFILTIFRGAQKEYGLSNCFHDTVSNIVNEFLQSHEYFYENLSTELDCSWHDMLRKSIAIEKFISCADIVITTRLHGLVHTLRSGRMAIAIDQIKGGAKVASLCRQIDYPYFILAENLTTGWLQENVSYLLSRRQPNESQKYLDKSLTELSGVKSLAFGQLNKFDL